MYRVSFTGHRPLKLPFFGEDDPMCIELKQRISEKITELYNLGAREFFTGMALGVDMWCAEAVLELKKSCPEIALVALLPCREQTAKWNSADKKRYDDILTRCRKKIYISEHYTNDCMHKRDRALVDICDFLVAVFDGKAGGTKYTVDYANQKGRKVIVIPPM